MQIKQENIDNEFLNNPQKNQKIYHEWQDDQIEEKKFNNYNNKNKKINLKDSARFLDQDIIFPHNNKKSANKSIYFFSKNNINMIFLEKVYQKNKYTKQEQSYVIYSSQEEQEKEDLEVI